MTEIRSLWNDCLGPQLPSYPSPRMPTARKPRSRRVGFFLRETVASEKGSAHTCTWDAFSGSQLPKGHPLNEAQGSARTQPPTASALLVPPVTQPVFSCLVLELCKQRRTTGCFGRASSMKEWKQIKRREGKKEFRVYSKHKKRQLQKTWYHR